LSLLQDFKIDIPPVACDFELIRVNCIAVFEERELFDDFKRLSRCFDIKDRTKTERFFLDFSDDFSVLIRYGEGLR